MLQKLEEEYAARLTNIAEEIQMELMLEGHNWKEYMTGIGRSDEAQEKIHEFILSGGDYYGFIMQADLPEVMKEKYIKAYEDAYVSEIICALNPPYPGDATKEDKWISSMMAQESNTNWIILTIKNKPGSTPRKKPKKQETLQIISKYILPRASFSGVFYALLALSFKKIEPK